jgi:hypothetical protein
MQATIHPMHHPFQNIQSGPHIMLSPCAVARPPPSGRRRLRPPRPHIAGAPGPARPPAQEGDGAAARGGGGLARGGDSRRLRGLQDCGGGGGGGGGVRAQCYCSVAGRDVAKHLLPGICDQKTRYTMILREYKMLSTMNSHSLLSYLVRPERFRGRSPCQTVPDVANRLGADAKALPNFPGSRRLGTVGRPVDNRSLLINLL